MLTSVNNTFLGWIYALLLFWHLGYALVFLTSYAPVWAYRYPAGTHTCCVRELTLSAKRIPKLQFSSSQLCGISWIECSSGLGFKIWKSFL